MKSDELYSYLGYAIIAVLIFLILKTIMKKNQPEGFMGLFEGTDETKEDTKKTEDDTDDTDDPAVKRIEQNVKEIQDATNKTIEQMNLVKYRKNWEDLIVAMEDRIDSVSLQSLSIMAAMIKANPNDEKLIKVITRLNEFNKYKTTLKENMEYLDGLK
jgi:hypothetical protein|tara:strand:- start:326 stop:799 length:474 start_codon:yes stop_codon:yes gene_type:complete